MAGTLLERELKRSITPRFRFEIATPEHDSAIRRLLRDNPIAGDISVSFEREPNYFTQLPGAEDQAILAFDQNRLACTGRCCIRSLFINGQPRRVGYLSELRLDWQFQGRSDILRHGYRFFESVAEAAPADFYFTSISADNKRSLRFLEANLPGMPDYKLLTGFATF